MAMTTCISKQLQIYATRRPHVDDKFLLSNNFKPKFTSIPMLNNKNNTSFRISCSISSSSNSNNHLVDHRRHSCSRLYPICNLFDDIPKVVSRMLALAVVMTLALLCIQIPASAAASYGRMGGGSSGGSSQSSSSSSSSNDYYIYDDDSSSCNCKTPTKKKNRRRSRSCTICDCYKEKNQGKGKSCADCSCYKLKECNCNCHIPCGCSCHASVIDNAIPFFILFCICICVAIAVMMEEDTIGNNSPTWMVDNIWGSVIMIQVGILDKKRVLQRKLNRIGGAANTVFKSGLSRVLKEVVNSLLEHHDHCHFAYLYAKYGHLEKSSRPCFRRFLETEIAKFDNNDETFVNVDGVKYQKESGGKVNSIDNEYSVVTLLVLVNGEYLIPSLKGNSTRVNKGDIETALETIYSIPRSNLEAVEVLWTPQMENDVVSKQDVRRDFGILMRPVD